MVALRNNANGATFRASDYACFAEFNMPEGGYTSAAGHATCHVRDHRIGGHSVHWMDSADHNAKRLHTADTDLYSTVALASLAEPYSALIRVSGSSDAHIFLSSGGFPAGANGYEIVLGRLSNTKSELRVGRSGTVADDYDGAIIGGFAHLT